MFGQKLCKKDCGRFTRAKNGVCTQCKERLKQIPCEMCEVPRGSYDNRFCSKCRKVVSKNLEAAGYLQQLPSERRYRDQSERENIYETKFGLGR